MTQNLHDSTVSSTRIENLDENELSVTDPSLMRLSQDKTSRSTADTLVSDKQPTSVSHLEPVSSYQQTSIFSRRIQKRTTIRRSRVSLKQLQRRIERLEYKVMKQNQQEDPQQQTSISSPGIQKETIIQQSRVSLKGLQRRVKRIEHHLKKQNQLKTEVELSTKNCLKLLLPEAKNWQNIGTLLEIPEEILDRIEAEYPSSCHLCVREMIKAWIKQVDPPPSWKNLAEAVREFNPSLAKKIIDTAAGLS